jgi:hypothetical protein
MADVTTRNGLPWLAGVACVALLLAPARSTPQQQGGTTKSLADIAREQRSKDRQKDQKPAKVFTNDDFPAESPASSAKKPVTETPSAESANSPAESSSDSDASGSGPHDEAYFRNTMKRLREKLKSDQERLVTLRKELADHEKDIPLNATLIRDSGPNAPSTDAGQASQPPVLESGGTVAQKSYSNDPRWATNPEGAKRVWESEEQELGDSISSQKRKITADEKAISDFVDQCRREGCEPGWIR